METRGGAHFQDGKRRLRHPGVAGLDLATERIVGCARNPFPSASAANRLCRALSAVSQRKHFDLRRGKRAAHARADSLGDLFCA